MKVLLRHIMVAPNLYNERRESFRPDSTAEEGCERQTAEIYGKVS